MEDYCVLATTITNRKILQCARFQYTSIDDCYGRVFSLLDAEPKYWVAYRFRGRNRM